jgi:multiple sugar transport system substrate-binding protein
MGAFCPTKGSLTISHKRFTHQSDHQGGTMLQNKRSMIVLTILLILSMTLAACAPVAPADTAGTGSEPAPAASEGPTTITWAFWGSPEEAASHKAVGDAFMQAHPEIQIEYYNEPWGDYFTKVETLWASGDSAAIPDVLFLWPTPKYAAQGVLENLDSYIEKSSYNLDDYWPALLESASYDGSV